MKYVLLLGLGFLHSACTHTISFRASHFASPVTGENQWNGHIAAVASSVTRVTVLNDITTTPPTRTSVDVNKDIDPEDLIFANNFGIDGSLTFLRSLDLYVEGSLYGIRWQFLNHGSNTNVWVGAIQGAYGERSHGSSATSSDSGVTGNADSKIKTSQGGISFGYKFPLGVPYVSFIHENHNLSTTVNNGTSTFGPYSDKGIHQYFSVGVSSHGRGFAYALEYNMINISWDRSEPAYQNAAGAKIGFAW